MVRALGAPPPLFSSPFVPCPPALPPLLTATPTAAAAANAVPPNLQEVCQGAELVAVHDSARPLVSAADTLKCMLDAAAVGAAVLGVPVKPTIKVSRIRIQIFKYKDRHTSPVPSTFASDLSPHPC